MQTLHVKTNSLIFIFAYIVALIVVVQTNYGRSIESSQQTRPDRMLTSHQPVRILAVFVIAPILFHKSIEYDDMFITSFAMLLFTWDLFWLMRLP